MNTKNQLGGILIMTVILLMMLTVMFISLSDMTNRLYRKGGLLAQDETAFQIAEAGLNFARWRLAHDPTNYTPISRTVSDQLKGVIGTYDISFTPPPSWSNLVGINAVGYTADSPTRKITIDASYGKASFAKYSSITNSDVWYASTISGAVHSNGGIRMDGVSDSSMSSAKETYVCQTAHNCNNEVKPGVWGTGSNSDFWEYPVASVDYAGLTSDLLSMRATAINNGTYFGPSGAFGYRLQFVSSNRYTVYRVTAKTATLDSYASDTGWQNRSDNIATNTVISPSNRTVPANGILFFEDTVWVAGTVENRITVAAGRAPYSPDPNTNLDIVINGDISYGGVLDGSRSFAAIAQGNILIPHVISDVLRLDGAYVAQYGRFGRRYYTTASNNVRTSLTRYGMVASNLTPVTSWSNGFSVVSGFINSFATYDPNLLYAPPPFFPTSGKYQILSWKKTE